MSLSPEQKKFLKKQKKNKIVIFCTQIFLVIAFLFIWQFLADKKIINSFIFSSPKNVLNCFIELLNSNNLYIHIYTTLKEVLIAFLLGIGLGFIIAIVLYSFKTLNKILEPFLTMLNSLPKVALGPMIIIWCGANTNSIIIMALLISVITSVINILNSFNSVDELKIKMLKSLGAGKLQILWYIIIPNSYQTIISTLKINIAMTLIGVIMGEFLVSKAGIGYLIIYGTQVFNLDLVITGIALLAIISFILYKLIATIERILIKSF